MGGNLTTRGKRLTHWLRLQVGRVVRENSTPARTGLGFALGAFIGVFPSFLIGSPLAFFLARRFGWNRAAAVAGTFLMNPVTAPVFYWISTWLGLELLGRNIEMARIAGLVNHVPHLGLAFLVGNTLFALVLAGSLGTLVFLFVQKSQRGDSAQVPASSAKPSVPAQRHAVPEVGELSAPCTNGPLTHFASPRTEKSGLDAQLPGWARETPS